MHPGSFDVPTAGSGPADFADSHLENHVFQRPVLPRDVVQLQRPIDQVEDRPSFAKDRDPQRATIAS